ncbi:HTTM domain-containing protein [uncultured Agrococcus sp.]|uniref:HTTM domain-containing protein n=1 Tax=uncultured Agrococcus sp. TaxID=382258 RepID=UPI0025FA9A26|nr:HTTM domain-containing protein [uncultured Agrococcus sp.]
MSSLSATAGSIGKNFFSWLLDNRRASYGLAIMRISYGLMTLVTIALYLPNFSYTFGQGSRWGNALNDVSSVNNYPWPLPFPFSREDPDSLLMIKVLLLAIVTVLYILGWRMRITSPLFVYLWLGFTALNPVLTNSGHYQTLRVMLIIMLFADLSRRWSLDARRASKALEAGKAIKPPVIPKWFTNLLNNVAVILVGYQLCTIYVVSALWKLQGSTWMSGVAVYYPLQLEELTIFPWLNEILLSMTPVVFLATWMSVYVQLLFPLMLLHRWTRIAGLILITGMHIGIGVMLAIPFFSLVMIAADMIFIRDKTWGRFETRVKEFGGRFLDRFRARSDTGGERKRKSTAPQGGRAETAEEQEVPQQQSS